MKIRKVLCQMVVWSASISITAPQLSYGAEAATRPTPSAVAPVRDVALSTRATSRGKSSTPAASRWRPAKCSSGRTERSPARPRPM